MIPRPCCNLYIASCAPDGGILHCRMRGDTLEPVSLRPLDRPMYMAIADDKLYILLRAPFGNADSGLVTCDIAPDGSLGEPSPAQTTMGEVACHLAVNGGDVYAVNYISGSVWKSPDKLALHSGRSIHPMRQTSPHTHFVCPSPDGKYLFVTDLGLDRIFVYDKNLRPVSSVDLPPGHGPRHLAFHADRHHLFCVNELKSTISLLTYNEGRLTLLDTVAILPRDYTGESTAAAVRCVGDTVYASNRGHDSVSCLDFSGDSLSLRGTIPTHGGGPRDFIVHDNHIIAANEVTNSVCIVSLANGSLLQKLSVKAPVCVLADNGGNW